VLIKSTSCVRVIRYQAQGIVNRIQYEAQGRCKYVGSKYQAQGNCYSNTRTGHGGIVNKIQVPRAWELQVSRTSALQRRKKYQVHGNGKWNTIAKYEIIVN
jgi:hypothetical protein